MKKLNIFIILLLPSVLFTVLYNEAFDDGEMVGSCICNDWDGRSYLKQPALYRNFDSLNYLDFKNAFLFYLKDNCPEKFEVYRSDLERDEREERYGISTQNESIPLTSVNDFQSPRKNELYRLKIENIKLDSNIVATLFSNNSRNINELYFSVSDSTWNDYLKDYSYLDDKISLELETKLNLWSYFENEPKQTVNCKILGRFLESDDLIIGIARMNFHCNMLFLLKRIGIERVLFLPLSNSVSGVSHLSTSVQNENIEFEKIHYYPKSKEAFSTETFYSFSIKGFKQLNSEIDLFPFEEKVMISGGVLEDEISIGLYPPPPVRE